MKTISSRNQEKGFTMIEMIVAIAILVSALIVIYTAFAASYALAINASDRIVAAYLAQEGIEIVRNVRDNNWLSGNPNWNSSFTGSSCYRQNDTSYGCEADYQTGTSVQNSNDNLNHQQSPRFLNINASGFYS